ncbi:MAG: hypothetical protein ABIU38_11085 [Vicinamibacteraceae bacterium]
MAWAAALGVGGAQTTTRVSTDASGTQVAGASWQPSASADGRFVAFSSTAATLVAGDGNGSADVFVKDRQTGAVTRVSVRTGGMEAVGDSVSPDISADGRYVTFVSAASLTADDNNVNSCLGATLPGPTCPDVFVHDRTTGATIRASVTSGGVQSTGASAAPRISGDGRYVVFESVATNLVAADTNQRRDIFLHDVQTSTTSRLSVPTGGSQSDRDSRSPSISDDGSRVIFLSDAALDYPGADPLPCDAAALPCTRAYRRYVPSQVTARLGFTVKLPGVTGIIAQSYRVVEAVVSPNGSSGAVVIYGSYTTGSGQTFVQAFGPVSATDIFPAETDVFGSAVPSGPTLTSMAVDATGRVRAYCIGNTPTSFLVQVFDLQTWVSNSTSQGTPRDCEGVSLTADGLTAFFATSASTFVPGDTNAAFDVFGFDLDGDDDGMSVGWETNFRLSDANPADAFLDPDSDGVTNRQEYVAGTNPRGLFKYYLAEGAQNAFFNTEIAVFKPATTVNDSVSIVAQFQGQNGRRTTSPILNLYTGPTDGDLFIFSEASQGLETFPLPDQAFSILVESEQRLAVERTLTWGGGMGAGYGSHAERAISGPAATWYFAEGATHGAFDLFYLLQNPGATAATATITYLLPAPRAPIVRAYALLPNSRRTIYVDQEPGLDATDVSARIDATQPIFAERAMYMTTGGQPFSGGTASAGITAPALQWFIAEGATGAFFDLYILIGNPSASAAAVSITYLLPDGTTVERVHQVAAESRQTIAVKGEDVRLAATAVSATIASTNGTPIVVERAMWWPSPNWYEGTVTAATTTSAVRWALAGGFIDPRPDTETYLLVANPGLIAANVTIDVGAGGDSPDPQFPDRRACRVTVPVPARGRYTTGLKSLCPALGTNVPFPMRVAGIIGSDGPPIVVERSTYWSTADQFWAAGASTLLTPLP